MPQNNSPHDVFISYSRKNKDKVLPIKDEIERALGLRCWIDLSDIPCGAKNFKRIVIPGIKKTRIAFLFFLSAESQASENAIKEIGFASSEKGANKRVILIRFNDDAMTDDFYFDFQNADIIDWRVPEQREKLLRDLDLWSRQAEQCIKSGCVTGDAMTACDGDSYDGAGAEKDGHTDDVHPAKLDRGHVSRRVVCGIVALLALLGGTVCAGVCWYNERRAKNSVVEIRVESTVLKEKMGSIPRKDGFGQKIDAVSDECRKAEAFYGAGRWHESAVVFTNYVQHCKELVDLDRERQSAERAKEPAEKAQQQAKSLEAKMYAAAGWSLAVQTFEKADDEFRRMEFAASRASYEMSTRQFEECAKVAKSEKIRLAQEEEQRRLEEQRRREAEKLEAERRQKEELHRREAQRQDAEKLAKIRAGIKVKVREAKRDMERIADFRADPVGFTKHIDNADGKWKYIEVVETNPATVAEAEAVLKLVEECESEIADALMWLKANKAARDEAKNVEKEIVRYIDPELRRVEASRYAKEAFLAGKRLRDDGNSALAQGDFLIAKDRLLAAKKKLLEAMAEAKSPWASDVWKKIEPEVLSIRLEYEKHVSRNRLVVHVPQARLDLGDAQLTLDLMKGTNVVDQIKDVTLTSDGDNPDYRRAEMKCLARRTKGIDAYVLHISYQSLPIDLRFIPTVGVNIEAGKFAQDVSSFALVSVSVMGERREFLELDAQIQGDVIMSISNNLNCAARSDGGKYLWALGLLGPLLEAYSTKDRVNSNEIVRGLKFSQTLTEVRTNGLLHVQANAQDYNISYTNEAPSKCRVVIDATFLNPCGAQIFTARDDKKLGAWEGGESILSIPRGLQGCELPSYVILKWTRK